MCVQMHAVAVLCMYLCVLCIFQYSVYLWEVIRFFCTLSAPSLLILSFSLSCSYFLLSPTSPLPPPLPFPSPSPFSLPIVTFTSRAIHLSHQANCAETQWDRGMEGG